MSSTPPRRVLLMAVQAHKGRGIWTLDVLFFPIRNSSFAMREESPTALLGMAEETDLLLPKKPTPPVWDSHFDVLQT